MTTYSNSFMGVNLTGQTITNVVLTHKCAKHVETIEVGELKNGEATVLEPMLAESGHNDLWSVSFNMGVVTRARKEKQCNMPNETSRSAVLILYTDDFSVITPDGGPCLQNSY